MPLPYVDDDLPYVEAPLLFQAELPLPLPLPSELLPPKPVSPLPYLVLSEE